MPGGCIMYRYGNLFQTPILRSPLEDQFSDYVLWRLDCEPFVEILERTCRMNDEKLRTQKVEATLFDSAKKPEISFADYIWRIVAYARLTHSQMIHTLIYLDRCQENFFLTSLNFYRLFLVAALVAQKFHQDDSFSNKSFADLVGITVKELNILEAKFLFAISFSLYVLPKTYKEYNRIVGGQRINRQLVEARRSNLSFFSLFPHTVNTFPHRKRNSYHFLHRPRF
ncbi:cyclin family putative virulence effector [Coxiella burnetii]|uniref:cyclin family putative virulence effector n=1 Tax=Coxiella burnetii TaxID=777 RepID=UPI00057D52C2|nr:cyclin family putative virulence effector [Coxiella burnetii]